MCRMFCLTGNYSDDFDSIMKSFFEVTKNDPIITAKEGNFKSHDHGGGMYIRVANQLTFSDQVNLYLIPPYLGLLTET